MKKTLFPNGWDKGQAPTITEYVASQFDECARLAAGGLGIDVNEKLFWGLSAYEFATIAGKIPAALMTAGAGPAVETLDVVATIQTGVTSAENIARRITELRKAQPDATWDVILFDSQVQTEFATLLGSALKSLGAFKQAFPPQVAKSIEKWGLPIDIVTLVPDIQKAVAEYNDTTKTPEERNKIALDKAAEILGSLLGTIGKAHQERREATAAAAGGQP